MAFDQLFAFKGGHDLEIKTYGSVLKKTCPVCDSAAIEPVWRIPMTQIDPPATLFGGYFNLVPTLKTPFQIYGFDLCRDCESVFLNPDNPRDGMIASYKKSTHYLVKMKNESEWRGYEERYRDMAKYFPAGATSLVDAACGMGQILFLARKDTRQGWRKTVGLELSEAYVANMRENGIDAHVFDLDRDDHRPLVGSGTADFVSFFEAFEHVASPLTALRKLLDILRPGGRVYFSAQRYGTDVKLAVRPGEPIYIGRKLLDSLPQRLGCKLVDVTSSGSRYFVVLERTQGGAAVAPTAA